MPYFYTDPAKQDDKWALPNAEVFYAKAGWYWWYCLPGCMPDSDPFGPFDTWQEAEADARSMED